MIRRRGKCARTGSSVREGARVRGAFVRTVAACRHVDAPRPLAFKTMGCGVQSSGLSAPGRFRASRSLPGLAVRNHRVRARRHQLRAKPSCRLARAVWSGVVCRGHAPLSIPARVEDRLKDGDNVVNNYCATMHSRSHKTSSATKTCSKCADAQAGNVRKTDISWRHGVFFPRESTIDAVVWPMPVVAALQKDKDGHDALRSCGALWCRRVAVIAP
jgi:hypothetical protein